MPVISVASPKGGCGKTTSCLVLATTLAAGGATVTILDADPNRPIVNWKSRDQTKSTVNVIGDVTEKSIVSAIEEQAAKVQFVFIDLEGTASLLVSRALSRSDVVVIPMQASAVDAQEAAKALNLVRAEEEAFKREIPHRVLLTRTNTVVKTRNERMILDELRAQNIPMLANHLNQRVAFSSMFTWGQTLEELDEERVNGLQAARDNAKQIANELVELVIASQRDDEAA